MNAYHNLFQDITMMMSGQTKKNPMENKIYNNFLFVFELD